MRRIIVADELDAMMAEGKNRSLMVQRFASDLSVLLEEPTDVLFVRQVSDIILKRGVSSEKKKQIIREDEEKFQHVLHNFQRPGQLIVRLGWPIEEITALINKRKDIEALVIGTKAYRGAERFFLGSVAEEVIRAVKRPVYILGPGIQKSEYRISDQKKKHLLIATDLTKKSRLVETYALSIAKKLKAKVTFYYNLAETLETAARFDYGAGEALPVINTVISDIRNEALRDIEKKVEHLRSRGIECDYLIEEKNSDIASSIIEKLEEKSLLFMGHRSRGIIASTFIGSNVRALVMEATIPIVVVRN
jgi:nucleotide-binding universal stress UspA family protein